MSQFWQIVTYGMLAAMASLGGLYLVLHYEKWARKNSILLISFSAGVLLSVGLGHIFPEALVLNSQAVFWFLGSFIAFYILEHGIILHTCLESKDCLVHPIDRIALFGLGFHSLLDGIVIGVGFEVSPALGIMTVLSVLLHKLPDGISLVSILLHSGYERGRVVGYSWVVAILTLVGAVGSFFLLGGVSSSVLGILLAAVAGSFLYVAATDLIPEIHKKSQVLNIVLVVLGVSLPFLISWFLK